MARKNFETLKSEVSALGYTLEKKKGGGYNLRQKGKKENVELQNLAKVEEWLKENKDKVQQPTEPKKEQPEPEKADEVEDEKLPERNVTLIIENGIETHFLPDKTVEDKQIKEWTTKTYVPISEVVGYFDKELDSVTDEELAFFLSLKGVSIYFLEDRENCIIGTNKSFVWDALEVA